MVIEGFNFRVYSCGIQHPFDGKLTGRWKIVESEYLGDIYHKLYIEVTYKYKLPKTRGFFSAFLPTIYEETDDYEWVSETDIYKEPVEYVYSCSKGD